ncbi:HNH endonuclease [Viridibacillus sp. NPDC093762]|uniref:HNH endonuclease n=1 Tax=Viridibacillus sp. NPDC093762 TaxID=3390720 RepID=UPI003D0362EA
MDTKMLLNTELDLISFIKVFGKYESFAEVWKIHKQLKKQNVEFTFEMYNILFDFALEYSDGKKVIRRMKKSNFEIESLTYNRLFWKIIYEDEMDNAIAHFERVFKRPALFDMFSNPTMRKYENDTAIETREKLKYNYNLLFVVGDLTEEDFQLEIQSGEVFLDKSYDSPRFIKRSVKSIIRNPLVSAKAINDANFQCEINSQHETFINASTRKQYIEAHHLIPLKFQEQFDYCLDVVPNVVSLCPTCHRRFHHGLQKDKARDIEILFISRKNELSYWGFEITFDKLLSMYN